MKCWNCRKTNKNKGYNFEFCSCCGLYIESIDQKDLKEIVDLLEKMLKRLQIKQRISFYLKGDDGLIEFNHNVFETILDHIFFKSNEITICELNALIKAISYLSRSDGKNITDLAIKLFWFSNDFFNSHQNHLHYWVKKGLKEKCRVAYECLSFEYYNPYTLHKKRTLRKMKKMQKVMRSLPNLQQ